MECSAINSNLNFAGKYQLNANQSMPNQEACLKRDFMLGVACSYAQNGAEVSKKLYDFYNGVYNKDKNAPCEVVFDIPKNHETKFETYMAQVGQRFDKLA